MLDCAKDMFVKQIAIWYFNFNVKHVEKDFNSLSYFSTETLTKCQRGVEMGCAI